jgi:hypothetical protein
MTTRHYLRLICFLLAIACPAPSFADVVFYVAPEGDKSFAVEADDISEKASIEITVLYDPELLSGPRVTLETGTLSDLWDSSPGTLVFRVDQGEEPAPSFLAHLGFNKKGDAPGGIISVKGKITEPDGTVSPSSVMPNIPIALGSSVFTADSFAAKEPVPEDPAAEEDGPSQDLRHLTEKSEQGALQRFLEYRGERQVEAFVALFENAPHASVLQEPSVVLSDGKTPVKIWLAPEPQGNAPNVALSDAKLVELRNEGEKGWVITALPNEGTWNASLIVQTGEKVVTSSLAVAPPVSLRQDITRANFLTELDRFISGRTRSGKGDGDPLRRHLYEYIFTANFLAGSGNSPAKVTKAEPGISCGTK